jgi:hypothetical protein
MKVRFQADADLNQIILLATVRKEPAVDFQLKNPQAYIPNYRERRVQRHYIGRAHVEKGNDLIGARRQKHQGMHRSEQTSDAPAALRTLMLKGGWDLYWQKHQVLPLAIQVST